MPTPTLNTNNQEIKDETSLDLGDRAALILKNFWVVEWKKIIISLILGTALGLGTWLIFGPYSAKYVLKNNGTMIIGIDFGVGFNNSNNTNTNSNASSNSATNVSIGLDLATWKTLQKGLPILANEVAEKETGSKNVKAQYQGLSNTEWWQKNALAIYGISKADTKDLTSISKELDAASSAILGIEIRVDGDDSEQAINNAIFAANFLREGGAYLQIRRLLNNYEAMAIAEYGDIQRRTSATKIEISYKKSRLKFLQGLYKLYPVDYSPNVAVLGSLGNDASYLPLPSQISALSMEINRDEEELDRMFKRLEQVSLIKILINQSNPLLNSQYNGITLSNELISIIFKLRDGLNVNTLSNKLLLDEVHSQISLINTRFTKGLEQGASMSTKRIGKLKFIVIGLICSICSMILLVYCRKRWADFNAHVFLNK